MKKLSAFGLLLPVACTFLFSQSFCRAAEQVSNFSQEDAGYLFVGQSSWIASSFTTDDLRYTLSYVTVPVASANGSPTTISLSIFADHSGFPSGSPLETFAPATTSSSENVTFNSSGLELDPHTTYWVAVSGTPHSLLEVTESTAESGRWTIGDLAMETDDAGVNWFTSIDIGQFSVDADPVPEPGPLALTVLAAVCCIVRGRRKTMRRA